MTHSLEGTAIVGGGVYKVITERLLSGCLYNKATIFHGELRIAENLSMLAMISSPICLL